MALDEPAVVERLEERPDAAAISSTVRHVGLQVHCSFGAKPAEAIADRVVDRLHRAAKRSPRRSTDAQASAAPAVDATQAKARTQPPASM